MANEYTPWVELGMTELEYFKMRYLESQQDVARLSGALREIAALPYSINRSPGDYEIIANSALEGGGSDEKL